MRAEQCSHNSTAKVDLPLGQLVEALYRIYQAKFGMRKRKSNAPTELLEVSERSFPRWWQR